MARYAVRERAALDDLLTLAPERYDDSAVSLDRVALSSVALRTADYVRPGDPGPFVVFDTTHAADGFVATRPLELTESLQSAKRRLAPGDVIVSRLRPYLRQIAFVDDALAKTGSILCCSTEFFVLRSADGASIAFLVPYLLTPHAQAALARAQEGGHHPRVPAEFLARLNLPAALIEHRARTSASFLESVEAFRKAERGRDALVHEASILP